MLMLTDQIKNVFVEGFYDFYLCVCSAHPCLCVVLRVDVYINWTTWIQCPRGKHWKNCDILSMYTDSIDAVLTKVCMGNLDPTESREKKNKEVYLITWSMF